MMTRRSFALLAAMAPLALTLGGCDDRWKDYSYKMTVHVGDKAYSTVRHVTVTEGSTIQDVSGRRVDYKVEGEAVIIDTPSGPVFALMTPAEGDFGFGNYAAYVARPALMSAIGKPKETEVQIALREERENRPNHDSLADDAARHNAMLKVEGARDLPRTIPNPDPYRGPKEIAVWPMFVRFGDVADPASVKKVSPESIGVDRITVEISGGDPTREIEDRLSWLDAYYDKMLDGQHVNNSQNLANNLTPRLFRQKSRK